MDKNLYQLTMEQEAINAMLEENGGELTPEMEAQLQINAENATEKLEAYCKSVANYTAYVESLKAEAKRLTDKAKAAENTVERLKGQMLTYLLASGTKKTQAGVFTLSYTETQAVNVVDEALIPAEYKKTKVEVSKTDIRAALKKGVEVPGAKLQDNKNLQIK